MANQPASTPQHADGTPAAAHTPPVALTIAGSDSGGGAGVQADLTTFAALGVHGTSVLTALTAQNTAEVAAVHVPPVTFLDRQLDAVLTDLPPAATKTGMLARAEVVAAVAARARAGALGTLVVDPVLVASSGTRLFDDDFERAYVRDLLPHAAVITPNSREAAVLLGRPAASIATVHEQTEAALALADLLTVGNGPGPAWIVVKGGHLPPRAAGRGPDRAAGETPATPPDHGADADAGEATDVVLETATGQVTELRSPWVATANDHGTGCTFAAATAALLAQGEPVLDALRGAKAFVHTGLVLSSAWNLGNGHGPVAHIFRG